MSKFSTHLRNAFLAGIFAVIPVAVTAFVVWYIEGQSRALVQGLVGQSVAPFLGILVAIGLIYLVGVGVTSVVGRLVLRVTDKLLSQVPIIRSIYAAWKQIALTPGGGEGMYAKVVLVSDDVASAAAFRIGFTSGVPVIGQETLLPVFLPQCPNPIQGRLLLVPLSRCRITSLTPEEAFKMLISVGNYVPPNLMRL